MYKAMMLLGCRAMATIRTIQVTVIRGQHSNTNRPLYEQPVWSLQSFHEEMTTVIHSTTANSSSKQYVALYSVHVSAYSACPMTSHNHSGIHCRPLQVWSASWWPTGSRTCSISPIRAWRSTQHSFLTALHACLPGVLRSAESRYASDCEYARLTPRKLFCKPLFCRCRVL